MSFKYNFNCSMFKIAVWLSGIASVQYNNHREMFVSNTVKFYISYDLSMLTQNSFGQFKCFTYYLLYFDFAVCYIGFKTQLIFKATCINCMAFCFKHTLYDMLFKKINCYKEHARKCPRRYQTWMLVACHHNDIVYRVNIFFQIKMGSAYDWNQFINLIHFIFLMHFINFRLIF